MKKIVLSFYFLLSVVMGLFVHIRVDANSVYKDPDEQVSITYNTNGGSAVTDGGIEQTYIEYLKDNGDPLLNDITRGYKVIADDLDLDGDMDIIVGENDSVNGRIIVMENDGTGIFTRHLIKENVFVLNFVIVDIDQDGLNDILVSSSGSGIGSVVWLKRNSSNIDDFADPAIIDTTTTNTFGVDAADFDQDGDIDVISAQYVSEKVPLYTNDGSQTFTKSFLDETSSLDPYAVGFADLDGDTYLDIYTAYGSQNAIKLFMNNQDGTFTPTLIPATNDAASNGPQYIVHTDMDNDGDIDLFLTASDELGQMELKWYENDGFGNFTAYSIGLTTFRASRGFSVGDLDGDGDVDVVTQISNVIQVWINDGSMNFTKSDIVSINLSSNNQTAIADFDGNGTQEIVVLGDAVTATSELTIFGYGYFVKEPTEPTKDHEIFEGWYSDPEFTTPFDFSKPIVGDVTIYAKWEVITYSISYELNGGVNDAGNPSSILSSEQPVTLESPSKVGYTFDGWYLEPEFTTSVTTLDGLSDDLTLYAKWSIIQALITYELDGGINNPLNPASLTIEDGPFTLLEPTKTGFIFEGWYSDPERTTIVTTLENLLGDITLYARFSPIESTITYELDGGINNPQNITTILYDDDAFQLFSPTRLGYVFQGWYLNDNTQVFALLEITQDLTLYARWEAGLYDILFDANGGSGSMNAIEVAFDSNVTLPSNTFEKVGYTFTGWNTASDDSAQSFDDASLFIMDVEGITLYAQWAANTYDITYDANSGTGIMNKQQVEYDASIALSQNVFERDGFAFNGWNTMADGTGEAYDDEASLTMNQEGITLYAQWLKTRFVVTYELNGGQNNEGNPFIYNVGETITLLDPSKSGFNFEGWYTDSNFENVITTLRDLSDDVTLFAEFVDVSAPVVEGVTNNQVFEGGSRVSISFNEGTATLNGEAYESGEEITEPGDYTLIVTDASNNVSQVQFTIESEMSFWWIFLLLGVSVAGGAYWFFVLKDKVKEEKSNQNA